MATIPQTERVLRFTLTERAVHWIHAASFLALLLTGFALSLPAIEGAIGHRDLLREIHLSSAFFLFFAPAVIALAGNTRSVSRDVEAVETWDADDVRWLAPRPGRDPIPQGRFNAGQKLNAIFVAWATLTFTLTGLVMWQNRRFPLDVVSRANIIHTDLAYIALVAFLGHLYLSTLHPKTRHALRGMTFGWVRRDWAERHHPKAPATAADELSPRPPVVVAIQLLLGAAAVLLATRVLFFALGANPTDHVTSWLYALTAWPGVATVAPGTGGHIWDWPAIFYLLAVITAFVLLNRLRWRAAAQALPA